MRPLRLALRSAQIALVFIAALLVHAWRPLRAGRRARSTAARAPDSPGSIRGRSPPKQLDPEIDLVSLAAPYLMQVMASAPPARPLRREPKAGLMAAA